MCHVSFFLHLLLNMAIIFYFQVGPNSFVGEGTTLKERVSIKQSVVGKHCTIGEKVRITNCIIMDHVKISNG